MMALCPTIDLFTLAASSGGVSPEANALQEQVNQSVTHYLQPRLNLLVPEIEALADETAVKSETVKAAIRFAYCLPRLGPLPEVSVDPDGEISFDWMAPTGELFSVSVNDQSRLAYAGWFGEKSRTHGIEQLVEGCPQEIIRGIQKTTARSSQRAA